MRTDLGTSAHFNARLEGEELLPGMSLTGDGTTTPLVFQWVREASRGEIIAIAALD